MVLYSLSRVTKRRDTNSPFGFLLRDTEGIKGEHNYRIPSWSPRKDTELFFYYLLGHQKKGYEFSFWFSFGYHFVSLLLGIVYEYPLREKITKKGYGSIIRKKGVSIVIIRKRRVYGIMGLSLKR